MIDASVDNDEYSASSKCVKYAGRLSRKYAYFDLEMQARKEFIYESFGDGACGGMTRACAIKQ